MKKIPLTQGKFALVDDQDYSWLNQYKWYAMRNKNTYYAQYDFFLYGKRYHQSMHRLILDLKFGDKKQADHIDGNGLNNQRNNLRICSNTENCRNRKISSGYSSRYKGVSRYFSGNKWRTCIEINGKSTHIGLFHSQEQAAQAYNEAAKKYFGQFARLNEIQN